MVTIINLSFPPTLDAILFSFNLLRPLEVMLLSCLSILTPCIQSIISYPTYAHYKPDHNPHPTNIHNEQ